MKIEDLPRFHIVGSEASLHLEGKWVPFSRLPQQRDAKSNPPDSPRMVAVYYPDGVPKTLEGRGCYVGYFWNGYWHDECGQPCEPDPVTWSEILHW